jgi:DNA-nicking Smr family endonuclease
MGERDITDDEHTFWQAAIEGTMPLAPTDKLAPACKDLVHHKGFFNAMHRRHWQEHTYEALLTQAMVKPQAVPELTARSAKKLTPEARIDLHGATTAQAQSRLTDFITHCQTQGKRTVLIITGKGEGVLRSWFREWLAHNHASLVGYKRAPDALGGDGAFMVQLRRLKT